MFEDSAKRSIDIQETEAGCIARHEQREIARATLVCRHNPDAIAGESKRMWLLSHIEVDVAYRNAGIATEMFFQLKSWFQPLQIANLPDKLEDASGWSAQALGWLYRLNRKGLILKRWPSEHDTVKRLRHNRSLFER